MIVFFSADACFPSATATVGGARHKPPGDSRPPPAKRGKVLPPQPEQRLKDIIDDLGDNSTYTEEDLCDMLNFFKDINCANMLQILVR